MADDAEIRFEWDLSKRFIDLQRHGLDFQIVTLQFLDEAIVRPAKQGRPQPLGVIDDLMVSLVFRPLGSEAVSLISLRPATAKERSALWSTM